MVEQFTSELKHKDWNPYLHSVNDDLNILNTLLPDCYDLGKGNTRRAAINLQVFYRSRETFIRLPNVIKKIDKIVAQFHSPHFVKDYHEKKAEALQWELECISVLLDCLSQITARLSENTLIPEVKYKKKRIIEEDYIGASV